MILTKSAQFFLKMPKMAPNLVFTKGLNLGLVPLPTHTDSHRLQRSSRLTESDQILLKNFMPKAKKMPKRLKLFPTLMFWSQVCGQSTVPVSKLSAESLSAIDQEETDENLPDPTGDRGACGLQPSPHDFSHCLRTSWASGYFPVLSGLIRINQD